MSATKKYEGRGRKPLPSLERATRRAADACIAFYEADTELRSYIDPKDPKNLTADEKEILAIADRRLQLNAQLNTVLANIQRLIRAKPRSAGQEKELAKDSEIRDGIFEQLRVIPELGISYADWGKLTTAEKSKGLGRPPVSLELKFVRADIEYKEAMSEYKSECKKAGVFPKSFRQLIEYRSTVASSAGRPSGGIITELEKKLKRLSEKIEKIISGQAEAAIAEKSKTDIITTNGKRMGRPFEPVEEKLARHRREYKEAEEQIAKIESEMSPYELVQRQIIVVRRSIRAQNEILNIEKIDVEDSPNHPEVKMLVELEQKLEVLQQKRAQLEAKELAANNADDSNQDATINGVSVTAYKDMAKAAQKEKLRTASQAAVAQTAQESGPRVVDKKETQALQSLVKKKKTA